MTAAVHDVLHWLTVRQWIIFKLCYFVCSCVVGIAPVYLQELCVPVSKVAQCQWLHSSTYGDLCYPRVTTDRYGWRAFAVSGPQLWNQLPATRATCTDTPDCFKPALKASLFPWVGVMLQITEPLRNFLKGGYIGQSITLTYKPRCKQWVYHHGVDVVVNSVCWAPHEFGLILVCGSSDGSISVLTYIGTLASLQHRLVQ